MWDIHNKSLYKEFSGHTDFVNDLHVSWDGKFFISSSSDKTIRKWDIETGKYRIYGLL